jgi:hypothetical protein
LGAFGPGRKEFVKVWGGYGEDWAESIKYCKIYVYREAIGRGAY